MLQKQLSNVSAAFLGGFSILAILSTPAAARIDPMYSCIFERSANVLADNGTLISAKPGDEVHLSFSHVCSSFCAANIFFETGVPTVVAYYGYVGETPDALPNDLVVRKLSSGLFDVVSMKWFHAGPDPDAEAVEIKLNCEFAR